MISTDRSLPYKLGFATLTASLLMLGVDGDMPSPQHGLTYKEPLSINYSWEQPENITNTDFYAHNAETLEQIELLQDFAEKMLLNSKDLPVEIADIVSDNFEDLLA